MADGGARAGRREELLFVHQTGGGVAKAIKATPRRRGMEEAGAGGEAAAYGPQFKTAAGSRTGRVDRGGEVAAYGPQFKPPPSATGRRPLPYIEEQLRRALPDLFSGAHRSALYVGANRRRQHFLDDFVDACETVVILEAFPENAQFLREAYEGPGVRVVEGDVRNISALVDERFDACFFWHGPEHLGAGEAPGVLRALESITDHVVVLGMPYGRYYQGDEYRNKYERHLWHIYPEDMRGLGYETSTAGKADDRMGNMIAWKRVE